MPHPRSRKRSYDAERITAEFTPGQLVIGICVTLLLALMLFLLGIPVGKYQRYSDADTAAVEVEPPAGGPASTGQIGVEPPREEGAQGARPGQPRPFRPTPFPGENRPPTAEDASGATAGEAPGTPAPAEPPAPPEMPEAPAPPIAPAPPETSPPPASQSPAPPAARNDIDADLSPEAPPIATAPPPVQRPTGRGAWGVQVGAFTRESQAQDLRAQLLDREGLRPEIVRSEDGAYFRVIFVGYETRAAAQAVAEELKREAAFSGAWVRSLQ